MQFQGQVRHSIYFNFVEIGSEVEILINLCDYALRLQENLLVEYQHASYLSYDRLSIV